MKNIAINAKVASQQLMTINAQTRSKILESIATDLDQRREEIIKANQQDIHLAQQNQLSKAMIDRLLLDNARIDSMIQGVREINAQPEVVNTFYDKHTREDGLIIQRQRIPLGVILMIFESRPNVVVDCAALAIKSSNAIILKGGKEAKASNEILGDIIQEAIAPYIAKASVQVLASDKREMIDDLLSLNEYIDVVIPRGGEKLIRHVYDNSKIPVIAHFLGLCHIYIDKDADTQKAIDIVINAKTQRPGVCNAVETVIVHQNWLQHLPKLLKTLQNKETQLRLDKKIIQNLKLEGVQEANEQDWATEYLDNILSIKLVSSIDEAIKHIQDYGSHHSEAIITESTEAAEKFFQYIDASCVLQNASTRFNDGSQLGLGAELGISTTKIHAYGPMGAQEMTTSRFVVLGDGHIRV